MVNYNVVLLKSKGFIITYQISNIINIIHYLLFFTCMYRYVHQGEQCLLENEQSGERELGGGRRWWLFQGSVRETKRVRWCTYIETLTECVACANAWRHRRLQILR